MSELNFKVASDWQEVVRLRNEIARLEAQIKSMNANEAPRAVVVLNDRMQAAKREMQELVAGLTAAGIALEDGFEKKIAGSAQALDDLAGKMMSAKAVAGDGLSSGKVLDGIGGMDAIKRLGVEIIRVRGEFCEMERAMEAVAGKDKAARLMDRVKEYTLFSPLSVSDMAGAENAMLGSGIEADASVDYLKALGDISLGDPERFNLLAQAFSEVAAGGQLVGEQLERMVSAGFNPLAVMAEKAGTSVSVLSEEMAKGGVSAAMVQQAFIDATSAGGEFHRMSAQSSETINGQLSLMENALDAVFNEIGTKGEGVIAGSIKGITGLLRNYETVGKVLVGLVATYGVYKAAVIAVTAVENLRYQATLIQMAGMTKMQAVMDVLRLKTAALNKTMLANPYVAVAVALAATVAAVWALWDSTTAAERAQKRLNDLQDAFNKKQDERRQKVEELIRVMQDEGETESAKIKAYEELKKWSPALVAAYTEEQIALLGVADAQKVCNEERDRADYSQTVESINRLSSRLKELRAEHGKVNMVILGGEAMLQSVDNSKAIADAENELKLWQDRQKRWEELRKEAEEKNKPLHIRIAEAQADLDQIQGAFDEVGKKLNEEKEKLKASPWMVNPLRFKLQAEFNIVEDNLKQQQKKLAGLMAQEGGSVTFDDDFRKAKKEWEDAKRGLSGIESNRPKYSTQEYQAARKRKETAESSYRALGGNTGTAPYIDSYQQEKEIRRSALAIEEVLASADRDIRQQQIDLEKDGNEKQLAQIRLNYDKRCREIEKEESELLERLQDEERKQWEREHPGYKEKNLQFTPATTALPAEQRGTFEEKRALAAGKQQQDTEALLNGLLEKYRGYEAQRVAIEQQGNDEIKYLQSQRMDANAAEIDSAIGIARRKIEEGIKQINDARAEEVTGDNAFFRSLFGDVSSMGIGELQGFIAQAKLLREYLSGTGSGEGITLISADELKTIKASPGELDKVRKALDKLLGTGKEGSNNKWEGIFKTFENGFAGLEKAKGIKEISGAVGMIGGAAAMAAGELANMFNEMGNTGAADAISSVQQVMGAVANIGQGFAKGGIIGGIGAALGEALNFVGKAFAAQSSHKAALKEIMNEAIAQQREYNLLLMEQNLEYAKGITIFGIDGYGKAGAAIGVMKDALLKLNTELRGTGKYAGGYMPTFRNGVISFKDTFSKAKRDLYNNYEGLASIEVKTGHEKTGLFGWGKGRDTYSSVLDLHPDLIEDGKFNKDRAESIINTRTMSEESKNKLQYMIDQAKLVEEAWEGVKDYFTDIFGNLGESMSNALVDAFTSGTDAAQAFTDSVSDMLETLARQMIYSVTIGPVLERAQKGMLEVMENTELTEEQKFERWAEILKQATNEAVGGQEEANRLLEMYRGYAKESGFDIFTPDTPSPQEATSRGLQTMSQDTGAELNGRFTDLQMTGRDIREQTTLQTQSLELLSMKADVMLMANADTRNIADEIRTIQVNSYLELQAIRENTGAIVKPIREMNEKLDKIRDNTDRL